MPTEFIICSAVIWKGRTWYGHRHFHCYKAMNDELGWDLSRRQLNNYVQPDIEDGFVTSTGRFVGREEAQVIHKATVGKSHDDDGYRGDGLFSEDLY